MRFHRPLLALPALLFALLPLPHAAPSATASPPPANGASTAGAPGRVECSALASKILRHAVRFCAFLPPAYDADPARRFPVLYWLHGLGQNEQALVDSGGWTMVEEMRSRGEIGDFILITPDGGQGFYLNSRDGRNPYEDFFVREFVPGMERRYRVQAARATRGISGVSMGGFGALHFALKYPHLFGASSAHSAALMENPPAAFNSGPRLGFVESVFGWPVDHAYWVQNSAFTAVLRAPVKEDWHIYFDCGSDDDYGFDEGNRLLDRLLTRRGIPHEFHIYPGRHGWSYFARHLPASLEFHGKIFSASERDRK